MVAPTPAPWSVNRDAHTVWIEGPDGSGDKGLGAADRRIVCDFRLYGDADVDAETEANFALIVEAVNAR